MEPGLALMDEIGRYALTNAFIQFSKDNYHINPYKPLYWDAPDLPMNKEYELEGIKLKSSQLNDLGMSTETDYNVNTGLRKCPSDPYIQKGFQTSSETKADNIEASNRYDNLPSMLITPASVSNSTSWQGGGSAVQITLNQPEQNLPESSSPSTSRSFTNSENIGYKHSQHNFKIISNLYPLKSFKLMFLNISIHRYSTKSEANPVPNLTFKNTEIMDGFDLFSGYKVLTPTMYRSRMAAARQAISMDCYYSYQGK